MDAIRVAVLLGYGSLVLHAINVSFLLYGRSRTRTTLLHDALIRPTIAIAVAQVLLLYAHTRTMTADTGGTWVAVMGLAFALALWMLVPSIAIGSSSPAGDGYVILSRGIIRGLHVRLDKMYGPGPAHLIAYNIGKEAGEKDLRGSFPRKIPERLVWLGLPFVFRATGYGKLRYHDLVPRKEVHLRLRDSMESFAHADHDDLTGTCDLTRGYLAGMGKAMHPDLECHADETKCAHGDGGECEFVVRWFEPVAPPAGA